MRLFVGIALPDEVRVGLAALCGTLRPAVPSAKWVPQANFHVTLKFLGENSHERIPDIVECMRKAFAGSSLYELTLDRIGVFPSPKRARVLWLGVSAGSVQTTALAEALDRELATIGFRVEERPYHPHITLARLRAPKPLLQLAADAASGTPPIAVSVSVPSVTLFESKLSRSGAQYFAVEEVRLRPV